MDQRDTPNVRRDAKGTRLVVGHQVVCQRTQRVGQLLSVSKATGVCQVRFRGSIAIESLPHTDVEVAGWQHVRDRVVQTA